MYNVYATDGDKKFTTANVPTFAEALAIVSDVDADWSIIDVITNTTVAYKSSSEQFIDYAAFDDDDEMCEEFEEEDEEESTEEEEEENEDACCAFNRYDKCIQCLEALLAMCSHCDD